MDTPAVIDIDNEAIYLLLKMKKNNTFICKIRRGDVAKNT